MITKDKFKILENDHDNNEGAAERKWKAIIAKSNYKKGDYTSIKKCSLYYRYIVMFITFCNFSFILGILEVLLEPMRTRGKYLLPPIY